MRVEHAPDTGQIAPATDFVRLSGGKAANVAFLARRLGLSAQLLGCVGDDELAEQALAPLRAAGIGLDHVSRAEGCATAVSMIAVLPDGKKSIVLAENANLAWSEAAKRRCLAAIEAAPPDSLLVADYEVPADLVSAAVAAARRRGFPVVIDPSSAERAEKAVLGQALAVTPNPAEAGTLAGLTVDGAESAAKAARRFAEWGVKLACVKLPDGGCVAASESRLVMVPPVTVPVVDSTGAGDAFAGALAVALAEKQRPFDAVCFAVASSHVAVTGYGSQPAYPTRSQIDALLPRLLQGAHDVAT